MWLPQGGALKIENSQFTQYSIIMLARSYTQLSEREHRHRQTHRYTQTDTDRHTERVDGLSSLIAGCGNNTQYSIIMILSSMVYLILNITTVIA